MYMRFILESTRIRYLFSETRLCKFIEESDLVRGREKYAIIITFAFGGRPLQNYSKRNK